MPAGSSNYIPRPDGDFDGWVHNFIAAAAPYFDVHGPGDGEVDNLQDALWEWEAAYAAHTAAQAQARAAASRKSAARAACEAEARRLVRDVQSRQVTTDADRAAMGITLLDGVNTPTSAPTTRPLARVESGQRLSHVVRFSDEATPTRTARPRGVLGAEVWVALTPPGSAPPPMGPAYRFQALSSKGGARRTFPAAEAGKTAHYALRWVSTRGEKGPWSEVCSATVAA